MRKEQKELQNIAIILGVLLALDVVEFVLGLGSFGLVTDSNPTVQAIANGILIGGMAAIVITMLLQAFLVWKGFSEAKNPTGATLHVTIAKVFMIINVVLLVILVAGIFTGTPLGEVLLSIVICACDIGLMYLYMNSAKGVSLLK